MVAGDDAFFGLPELSVGVHGGARHLGRMVSQPVVRWMFFTGQRLSAAEMQSLGALIAVVPSEELLIRAEAEAERAASYSPTAVRMGKKGLNDIEFLDVRRGYELEQGLTARMMEFPDSKVALKPVVMGRWPSTTTSFPADAAGRALVSRHAPGDSPSPECRSRSSAGHHRGRSSSRGSASAWPRRPTGFPTWPDWPPDRSADRRRR